jgi:hypothetical protein
MNSKMSNWINALKIYNKDKNYVIPRKGTTEYDEVKKIMDSLPVVEKKAISKVKKSKVVLEFKEDVPTTEQVKPKRGRKKKVVDIVDTEDTEDV